MNDSQSTNNDQNQNQQIFNILEKMCNKIDGFENKLQQVETQNKEKLITLGQQFEKMEQRFEKLEIQNKENLEKIVQQQTSKQIIFVSVAVTAICVCLFFKMS